MVTFSTSCLPLNSNVRTHRAFLRQQVQGSGSPCEARTRSDSAARVGCGSPQPFSVAAVASCPRSVLVPAVFHLRLCSHDTSLEESVSGHSQRLVGSAAAFGDFRLVQAHLDLFGTSGLT